MIVLSDTPTIIIIKLKRDDRWKEPPSVQEEGPKEQESVSLINIGPLPRLIMLVAAHAPKLKRYLQHSAHLVVILQTIVSLSSFVA